MVCIKDAVAVLDAEILPNTSPVYWFTANAEGRFPPAGPSLPFPSFLLPLPDLSAPLSFVASPLSLLPALSLPPSSFSFKRTIN
ncbi:hypothetical protein D3C79_928170 [compost metagenome]